MPSGKFASAINCIDGRAQIPVRDWMRLHLNVDYVDMITEPGADKVLDEGPDEIVDALYRKLKLSVRAHLSRTAAVVGHHDCAANPVSREKHYRQISAGVERIQGWGLGVNVIGLWANEYGSIDVVCE